MKAIVRKENPHARVFPSLFCKGSLSVAVACCAAAELYAGTGCDRHVEVACVYYPHWHEYPKGNEWFHKGFNEWEFVKDAKPRVAGQKIPLRPLYGYLDGKNPADVAKEIDLASNAGIDVFLFDWYWYGGEMTMQESLEQGFLRAPNRMKMKFCLMWCYHDRVDSFRDDPRAPKRMLMKLPRTPEDFLNNIRYSKKFFHEPNHWMRDGKPFEVHVPTVNLPTMVMETDSHNFGGFMDKGEYLEFTPSRPVVTKWIQAIEECHRLAGGKWQNTLPQQQWIYEEDKPSDKEEYYL